MGAVRWESKQLIITSGLISHQYPPKQLFRTVLACKQLFIRACFSSDSDDIMFSLEEAILLIEASYLSWKQLFKMKMCFYHKNIFLLN